MTDNPVNPRVACDAMCGGIARWLRILGVDAFYEHGIADPDLVKLALAERRLVISSDRRLFERRVFTRGELQGLLTPHELRLEAQVRFVTRALHIRPGQPRCSACNGLLEIVSREEVADVVPARSLIWATEFFRCTACRHVFWRGSHWRRIDKIRGEIADNS